MITAQHLGYFEVDAYSKPLTKKITTPINLVLMEDVKDTILVGEGLLELKVVEFRRTFGDEMLDLLGNKFDNVILTDKKPQEGLSLVIYRVKPYWKANSRIKDNYEINGKTYDRTITYSSAAFEYESTLFMGEEMLQSADSTIYSNDELISISQAHPVFKNGFISVCENINKEIFKDYIIEKLQQP